MGWCCWGGRGCGGCCLIWFLWFWDLVGLLMLDKTVDEYDHAGMYVVAGFVKECYIGTEF